MNFARTIDRRTSIRLTGAVYTPTDVAMALTSFVSGDLSDQNLRILEPSVGDGAFLGALATAALGRRFTAIDVDSDVVNALRDRATVWPIDAEFHAGDFIEFACNTIGGDDNRFGLIIGNPPFIRKHNFSAEFKDSLKKFSNLTNYPLSDLKNSWAAFLIASSLMISDDGIVAFILPYELITVAYGHKALLHLFQVFDRIDLFISEQKAFPEIDQDAIIFVGRKQPRDPAGLFIQRVSSMANLRERRQHELSVTGEGSLALELNTFLISHDDLPLIRRLRRESATIGDYCTSAPGIVTAANDFFILTEEHAEKLNIERFTLPVLKKGSFSSRLPIFQLSDFEAIAKREPCRLLKIAGDRNELDGDVLAYVVRGEEEGFHERYKCRNRTNWYEVPIVSRAPGFFFKRSHEYPRVCINDADVYITDTAYGLHVKDGVTMRGLCFSFYNSLTLLFAETDGRFYGGGVLEISPNEFRHLPLIYHEPSDEEFKTFLAVHERADGDILLILDFGDQWLGAKLGLTNKELQALRSAWSAVRSHRLRHGRAR